MSLLTYPKFQAPELDGTNLSGGKVYFYIAGTATPKDTYSDAVLATLNTNPVILDARGEADIYLNGVYKIILKDADDVEVWTKDNSVGLETDKSSNDIVAPTVNDDSDNGYVVEWLWVDTVLKNTYICLDSTVGSAVWERLDSPLSNSSATTNPTVTDDSDSGYEINSPWVNVSLDSHFICVDASVGAAIWKATGATASTIYKGTAAGTADVLTATLTPTLASLADETIISLRALLANATTTPTIAFDVLAAWTIVKNGSQPLVAGDIAGPDHELWLKLNATNTEVELLNPAFADGTVTASKIDASTLTPIVQIVRADDGEVATGTTLMPTDDSIPQITEGNEFMTVSITPTSATNKLIIEVSALLSYSGVNGTVAMALFQDSTANALSAITAFKPNANAPREMSLNHEMVSGTTSSITFRIRAGENSAGTITFNGLSGVRSLGGVMNSYIKVTEVLQ